MRKQWILNQIQKTWQLANQTFFYCIDHCLQNIGSLGFNRRFDAIICFIFVYPHNNTESCCFCYSQFDKLTKFQCSSRRFATKTISKNFCIYYWHIEEQRCQLAPLTPLGARRPRPDSRSSQPAHRYPTCIHLMALFRSISNELMTIFIIDSGINNLR